MRWKNDRLPAAREEGLVIEQLAEETVVYDTETHDAHCLSPLAAVVFAHCDGRTKASELARLASKRLGEPVDEASVLDAVTQLEARNLLDVAPGRGMSRRDMIRKSAVVAGTASVAGPLISSVVAQPAVAQTTATCGVLLCCPCGTSTADENANAKACCFIQNVTLQCECTRADLQDSTQNKFKNCKPSGVGAAGTEFCLANPPKCSDCSPNQTGTDEQCNVVPGTTCTV